MSVTAVMVTSSLPPAMFKASEFPDAVAPEIVTTSFPDPELTVSATFTVPPYTTVRTPVRSPAAMVDPVLAP
jgi:hypothetical protein